MRGEENEVSNSYNEKEEETEGTERRTKNKRRTRNNKGVMQEV